MVEITSDGRALVGDPFVELAAAGLVDMLRRQPDFVREVLAEYFGAPRQPGPLADLSRALSVLLGEIRAEEVRAVGRALDGVDVNRARAEHLDDVARRAREEDPQ